MEYSNEKHVVIPQGELMDEAKAALSGRWDIAVPGYLVLILVNAVGSFIPFLSLLIAGPLAVGVAIFSLNFARDENPKINNIFDGFQNFGKAIGAYLLMILGIMIGFLLLIVPGFILAIGLSQTFFILADDPDIGIMDALQKSWSMMDGHKFDLFVLGLRFIPWAFLCIFTLGIGLLWLMPYMQVTFAKFYNSIRYGEHDGGREGDEDDILRHLVD